MLRPIEKTGQAESLYDLSKDVDELDAFVSHSWRDGRFAVLSPRSTSEHGTR